MKQITLILLTLLSAVTITQAQVKEVTSDNIINEFTFQVKSIDEFILRFNGKDSGYFKERLTKLNKDYKTSRSNLILSLIDNELLEQDSLLCQQFMQSAMDSIAPFFLDLYKSNLYAVMNGDYLLDNENTKITHILKLKSSSIDAKDYEWMISYVPLYQLVDTIKNNVSHYLSPSKHNQKFYNLPDYINKVSIDEVVNIQTTNGLSTYYSFVLRDYLKLEKMDITSLKYYIYARGWLIEIKEIKRKGLQSGYLVNRISKIMPQGPKEEILFKQISSDF